MKKVLSFVLVLAMILGSVSMAFAFTDDAAITNTEASKVLAAAGIIEGYTDGSFKPAGILTRAEGAAIAARMLLGKAEAAKLTTVVGPFNDVPASHWASGYISYCVSQGLLNGYGNGNFGPEDTLTVAAFGKMMLTALGYKSENEGFVGDAWETNVGAKMVKAGLTDGVTMSGTNACSREVAAQVALNTLKGELVKYEGTPTTVSTGSVTVTTGQSSAKNDSWATGDKENYKNEARVTAGTKVAGNVRFMNRYQKDLTLEPTTADVFGRPDTNKWTYKGESAYTAKSTDNLIATYQNKIDEKTLYNLLDGKDAVKNDITITEKVDGNATALGFTSTSSIRKNNTTTIAGQTDGTQVEVYYNSTDKQVTVVAYNYYLMKANADYSEKNKSVKATMESTAAPIANAELEKKDFAVENVKEDDYLVVTIAAGVVKTVAPASEITGTINSYTVSDSISIDGTAYKRTAKFVADKDISSELVVGSSATVVLDPAGRAFAVTDKESSKNYMYVYATESKNTLGTSDYKARVYFVDGTTQVVEFADAANYNKVSQGGVWVNYSVKSDGKYKVTDTLTARQIGGVGTNVTSGAVNFSGTATANSETVFFVKKANDTKVSVYTGYKAVPKVDAVATVRAIQNSNTNTVAKYVFVEAGSAQIHGASTSDYLIVYKTGTGYKTVNNGGDDYYTYDKTILNGGAAGVTEFDNQTLAINGIKLYKELTYSAEGRVEGGVNVANDDHTNGFAYLATITSAAKVKYSGNVLTWSNSAVAYAVDGNAPAFVIEGSDVTEVKASNVEKNLDSAKTYRPIVVFKNGETDTSKLEIKAIYFIDATN